MNKLDKKRLLDRLLNELNSFYSKKDFKLTKSILMFTKEYSTVFWGSLSTFSNSIVFRPQISVENKEIKNVLIEVFPNQPSYETIIRTLNRRLAHETYIKDFDSSPYEHNFDEKTDGNYYYDIGIETDLKPIIEDHINFMEKVGFPFFEKLRTLEGIDDYINDRILEGEKNEFQTPEYQVELKKFFKKREVLSGLIAAYLVHNPKLKELIYKYNLLWDGNRYILDDVDKVIEYFKSKQASV